MSIGKSCDKPVSQNDFPDWPCARAFGHTGKCHWALSLINQEDMAFFQSFEFTPMVVEPKPRECALYTITERNSGRFYVGISYVPKSRWKDHRKYARRGKGGHLYERMRELGVESFEFRICHWFRTRKMARTAELGLITWNIATLNMGKL